MQTVLQSCRAEQSRAEQSRAEQSRAEQSREEQSRAEQSRAMSFLRPATAGLLKMNTVQSPPCGACYISVMDDRRILTGQ